MKNQKKIVLIGALIGAAATLVAAFIGISKDTSKNGSTTNIKQTIQSGGKAITHTGSGNINMDTAPAPASAPE